MSKAQWLFDGSIIFAPDGKNWPAVSGPHGKGALPPGFYYIGFAVELDSSLAENRPYRDKNGFAWWCPLKPDFHTIRTGFGIHPDGNIPGTKGCIGIKFSDTRLLFGCLKMSANMKLLVEYKLKS